MKNFLYLFFLILLGSLDVNLAQAAIAVGPHCDQETLQGAIDAVQGSNTEIQVLSTYTSGPVSISNKVVQIKGGYTLDPTDDTCAFPIAPVNNATSSTLDGTGTSGPLISISGDSRVALYNLVITEARNSGHNGGGISFTSGGNQASLDIYATQIVSNQADRGAGIFYDGEAGSDQLTLHEESFIVSNTANVAGGGIAIQGHTYLLMNSQQTTISNNQAINAGFGGGLIAQGSTSVDVGSVGYNGFATIDHNSAGYGGGIYAQDQANVRIYSTSAGALTRVENNSSTNGGGIYLAATGSGHPQLCAHGAGINKNISSKGSAIYSTSTTTSIPVNFNDECNNPPGAVVCPLWAPCNTIDGNEQEDSVSSSTLYLQKTIFNADRLRMQGNTAVQQIVLLDEPTASAMTSCLISNNVANASTGSEGVILNIGGGASILFDSCTIANNFGTVPNIGLKAVFSAQENPPASMTLKDSIVWQPNVPTFAMDVRNVAVLNSIAADAPGCAGTSFFSCSRFGANAPNFVDVSAGDFHLTINSPTDYYAGCSGTDLDGLPRGVVVTSNSDTPCDPGAYEFQKPTFPTDENFDEINPSDISLPVGWLSVTSVSPGWSVVSDFPSSAPFSAYTPSLSTQSDSTLTTPPFPIIHAGLVSFKHLYGLETQYDGAILEFNINGGSFNEITRAGGRFVTGGYTQRLLRGSTPNPIEVQYPGCAAWTGGTVAYEDVSVELPASVNGKIVQLRWRVGTDGNNGTGYAGYHLDDIHVDENRTTSDLIFADVFGD